MHAWRKNEALCIFERILTMVMMLMTLDGHKFVYLYSVSYVVSHFPEMLYSYINYGMLASVHRLLKVTTEDRMSSNDSREKDPCMTVPWIFAINLYKAARNP